MHRPASTTKVSDELFSPSRKRKASSLAATASGAGHKSMQEIDKLPMYDPQSDVSKKEASRIRSAENAVHLIPVVVFLCFFVLWLFSDPNVELVKKDDSLIVDRIDNNMTIDGYRNGTTVFSSVDVEEEDIESLKQRVVDSETTRNGTTVSSTVDVEEEDIESLKQRVFDSETTRNGTTVSSTVDVEEEDIQSLKQRVDAQKSTNGTTVSSTVDVEEEDIESLKQRVDAQTSTNGTTVSSTVDVEEEDIESLKHRVDTQTSTAGAVTSVDVFLKTLNQRVDSEISRKLIEWWHYR